MITRITIKSEPADRSYKDRLTITRSSVRYENEPFVPGGKAAPKKWTVSSDSPAFAKMFGNLCEEVQAILAMEEGNCATQTTFTIMHDDGKKEERTLRQADEVYTVCFTIVDQMVRCAGGRQ